MASTGEHIRGRIDAALAATEAGRQQAEGTKDLDVVQSFEAVQVWLTTVSDELIALAEYVDGLHRDIHDLKGLPHQH